MTWHAKPSGAYSRTSQEAIDNAQEIYAMLYELGWTLNAVCGLLGNMGAESGYNPWRWQSDKLGLSTGAPWKNKGYGLTQFTPASKYISDANAKAAPGYGPNFSDKQGNVYDGYAQMVFLNTFADYYPTNTYPLSYASYKVSVENPGYLAKVWLYNYERPKDPASTEAAREENGNYWYELLSGEAPPTPPPVPPVPSPRHYRKLPIMYYLRRRPF